MMASEDQKLLSDPKYKQFTNAIDKCLKNFEYSSEWADLISCLGKLTKVRVSLNFENKENHPMLLLVHLYRY